MSFNKIIICVLILIIIMFFLQNKEYFNTKGCTSCSYKSNEECANCSNCGICIYEDKTSKCVSGDINGPYFIDNCAMWNYNNMDTDPYYVSYYPDGYYTIPNYRHYYGNNMGRRTNHKNNWIL